MTIADFFRPLPPSDALIFWVVYHRPADMPSAEYVVRPQYAAAGGIILCSPISRSATTLDEARALIPGRRMLYRQERDKSDPLCIVESWF